MKPIILACKETSSLPPEAIAQHILALTQWPDFELNAKSMLTKPILWLISFMLKARRKIVPAGPRCMDDDFFFGRTHNFKMAGNDLWHSPLPPCIKKCNF